MSKALVDVLNGREPRRRPIWFMRQAGRYLPEYRELRRSAGSFLDLCYAPELAAEVTLQPLRRYDLDAAIVFADILVVPHAMGVDVRFSEGEGPIVGKVDSMQAVEALAGLAGSSQTAAVCATLRKVRARLPEDVALIGFCGAPWTVASYMVGGGPAQGREAAQLAALREPEWFPALIDRLVEESIVYLDQQVDAGAEVLQIFDSWAGDLSAAAWARWVIQPISRIVAGVRAKHAHVPIIAFARGLGAGHEQVARETGAQGVSLESSVSMAWARRALCDLAVVQGNLDPLALLAGDDAIDRSTAAILRDMPKGRHIFNLGHGIRLETDPAALARVIRRVREHDRDG